MTDTRIPPTEPGAALLQADAFYRDRWSHDKVVNSTHGVNCTGSCRWKVYVKDGIFEGMTGADCLALSARSGWMPSYLRRRQTSDDAEET